MKPGIIVIVAAAAAVLLASCRDEENRAFVLDKGTYTGATYSQLSEKQIGALENRVALQGHRQRHHRGGAASDRRTPGAAGEQGTRPAPA